MAEADTQRITVSCHCGARLKVPKKALGRKAKCPRCTEVFVVAPEKPRQPKAPAPAASTPDDGDSLLDELARQESAAPSTGSPVTSGKRACPGCGAAIMADARMCTACGYDTHTGKKRRAADAGPGLLMRITKRLGPFALGCCLSGIGALIGAAVWSGVAIAADMQIGWIALGVGALAGYGMLLGYRAKNVRAGVVAASIGVAGILLGKVCVFLFILDLYATGETSDMSVKRELVTASMANEALEQRGVTSESEWDEQWDGAYEKAAKHVQRMDDREVEQRWLALRNQLALQQAYRSEEGRLRVDVARHHAVLRAEAEGISFLDERRDQFLEEEFARCKDWTAEQVQEELARIEAWNETGRFEDEEYVRNHLAFELACRASDAAFDEAESDEDAWSEKQWGEWWVASVTAVDAVTPQRRVAWLRELETEEVRDADENRLTSHLADRKAEAQGLCVWTDEREGLWEQERKAVKALTDAELRDAIAELERWEESGKWSDEAYVRCRLINLYVNDAAAARRKALAEEDDDVWLPSDEEREAWQEEAGQRVDAIAVGDRVAELKRREAQRQQAFESSMAESEREELKGAAEDLATGFFEAMFAPLDLLFFALAVMTAFRIASGRAGDD